MTDAGNVRHLARRDCPGIGGVCHCKIPPMIIAKARLAAPIIRVLKHLAKEAVTSPGWQERVAAAGRTKPYYTSSGEISGHKMGAILSPDITTQTQTTKIMKEFTGSSGEILDTAPVLFPDPTTLRDCRGNGVHLGVNGYLAPDDSGIIEERFKPLFSYLNKMLPSGNLQDLSREEWRKAVRIINQEYGPLNSAAQKEGDIIPVHKTFTVAQFEELCKVGEVFSAALREGREHVAGAALSKNIHQGTISSLDILTNLQPKSLTPFTEMQRSSPPSYESPVTGGNEQTKPKNRSQRRRAKAKAMADQKVNSHTPALPSPNDQHQAGAGSSMAPKVSKVSKTSDSGKPPVAKGQNSEPQARTPVQAGATKSGTMQPLRMDTLADLDNENETGCSNPGCKCNRQSYTPSLNSGLQSPVSTNTAEYGSGSEAAEVNSAKPTFEEALLATYSFTKRIRLGPSNEKHTSDAKEDNAATQELTAKAEHLKSNEAPSTPAAKSNKNHNISTKESDVPVEHYRQKTISSSLKEKERLVYALRELTGEVLPPKLPKKEKVGECGSSNAFTFSAFRSLVAEQFRPPPRNADGTGGLELPLFLLPGVLDLAARRANQAPPEKVRRRRIRYKTIVHPIPDDLKEQINIWEEEFKGLGLPQSEYMGWMIDKYRSFCKGLEKLSQLVTDMKEGPSSPQIQNVLRTAETATGISPDKYMGKAKGQHSASG